FVNISQGYLNETDALMMSHVQRLSLTIPDTFVSPKLWSGYADLIADILVTEITDNTQDEMAENGTHYLSQHMVFNLADIKKRNETMLFRNLPDVSSVRLGSAVSDVEVRFQIYISQDNSHALQQMLNSITTDTDVATLPFFPVVSEDWSGMPEKLTTLLTWSVTPLQFGDHRPFVAVTLIRHWRLKAGERANRRDVMPPDELLQDRLFEWLDSAEVSKDTQNIRTIALLYGELVKHHLFSYTRYLQRLIARGEPGLSFAEAQDIFAVDSLIQHPVFGD
ncbi:hypothetical protein MPER_08771, partial [Moniliophthora perniciosa FA553]